MNSKRTLARERRLAAVHEAGYVVIARRVGFKIASAWIMSNAGEVAEGERAWTGRLQIVRVRADKFACRMVGVAGHRRAPIQSHSAPAAISALRPGPGVASHSYRR